jgi:hypothetical protein
MFIFIFKIIGGQNMGWIAVDRDGTEHQFNSKPIKGRTYFYPGIDVDRTVVKLPDGTIEKLIDQKMSFDDEPVEIK